MQGTGGDSCCARTDTHPFEKVTACYPCHLSGFSVVHDLAPVQSLAFQSFQSFKPFKSLQSCEVQNVLNDLNCLNVLNPYLAIFSSCQIVTDFLPSRSPALPFQTAKATATTEAGCSATAPWPFARNDRRNITLYVPFP